MPTANQKAAYYLNNRDRIRERAKAYYQRTRADRLAAVAKYKRENPEKVRACKKSEQQKNKDDYTRRQRSYVARNREAVGARVLKWKKDNADRLRERAALRFKTDTHYRVAVTLRNQLGRSLKEQSVNKSLSASTLLGCDIKFFKDYIAAKFKKGMSWANHGEWHLDHIIPCAKFDLSDPTQQRHCFHYTNFQPLWALDNLRKNKTPPPAHQAHLI